MLSSIVRSVTTGRGPLDNFWYRPIAPTTAAGITVGDDDALAAAAFWACVRVLSDTLGAMPWHVYERNGEGDDQEDVKAKDYEWYKVLHDNPNIFQDAMSWKVMGVVHLCLRGNFYCRIDPPTFEWEWPQLIPLNPDRIEISRDENRPLVYIHKRQDGGEVSYPQERILHVRLMSMDGVKGLSPLGYARATLGLGLAQTKHASSIYGGGGFFKYFLKTTKRLGVEGRKNFREAWRDIHGDPNSFTPPILEDDMDIKTLGMTLEDSQLLESRKFGAYEICQFFGVPPHLIFLLDRATFSNIEHQSIEFSTIHLNPWLVRFEQAIQPQLEEGYFSQFARDSIVRGDISSRYDAYSKGLQGRPFLLPNDVRRLESLPPVDGWDDPAEPLNMAPAGQTGRQGEQRPGQATQQEPEGDEQARDIRPLIEAAANRIVHREVIGLQKRAGRAAEDRQLFNAWAGEWYAKHVAFVQRELDELTPVCPACGDLDATDYTQARTATLAECGDVAQLLKEWQSSTEEVKEWLCTQTS
jgi:HK97 family phage portal protein